MQLDIQNLTLRVERLPTPILQIPYFQLTACKQLAVLGESGSGKSTFLHAISGLIETPKQAIFWQGLDISSLSTADRDRWRFEHLGIIMQDFYLTRGLSALENVLLPYRFRHWRVENSVKQRAEDLLTLLQIPDLHRSIDSFSRGEMQRVAIARALLQQPKVLIADEPTASLDRDNAQRISDLLINLTQQEQINLIISTHDQSLSQRLKHQLQLDKGQCLNLPTELGNE